MALPDSRDETAVDGAPVNPALVNKLQDCAKVGSHRTRKRFMSALQGPVVFAGAPAPNGPEGMRMSSNTDQFFQGIEVCEDERILFIRGKVTPEDCTLDMTIVAYDTEAFGGAGNPVTLGSAATVTSGGSNENLNVDLTGSPFIPNPAGARFLTVKWRRLASTGAADGFIKGIEITSQIAP